MGDHDLETSPGEVFQASLDDFDERFVIDP
jgi:hypothetical protein